MSSLYKDKDINFSKPDQIMPLITTVLGNKVPKIDSYWKRLVFYYAEAPFAFIKIVWDLLTNKPDPKCIFRGEYAAQTRLALAAPIPVEKLNILQIKMIKILLMIYF